MRTAFLMLLLVRLLFFPEAAAAASFRLEGIIA